MNNEDAARQRLRNAHEQVRTVLTAAPSPTGTSGAVARNATPGHALVVHGPDKDLVYFPMGLDNVVCDVGNHHFAVDIPTGGLGESELNELSGQLERWIVNPYVDGLSADEASRIAAEMAQYVSTESSEHPR